VEPFWRPHTVACRGGANGATAPGIQGGHPKSEITKIKLLQLVGFSYCTVTNISCIYGRNEKRQTGRNSRGAKSLCFSYCTVTNISCIYGRNEKRQTGHNSRGAKSLWGRRMTAEGAGKSQQCRNYYFQYSTFAPERPQARALGR